MMVKVAVPAWWPPKVGDKLRMFDRIERGPIARLCHVVSVFDHDQDHAVVAYYGVHRQWWHCEVISSMDAEFGKYWPDGESCPDPDRQAMLERPKA